MLGRALHWVEGLVNPPVFAVAFANGEVRVAKGPVTAAWLADCTAIAREFGIAAGRVEGMRMGRGVELRFSREVPAASHQRFRNVFAMHRPER